MRDLMHIYRVLLRTAWVTVLEYRAQAVLWLISSIFPLVMMVVWLAVVDEAGPLAGGWGSTDFISYYVGAALVYQLTGAWVVWDWDEDIRTGKLSIKLLKPLDPFHHLLSGELGWKILILIFFVPIMIIIAGLTHAITYPIALDMFVAFVLSVAGGFVLAMLMASAFGVLAFWSTQARNLYQLWFGVGQFLSGWIAPLALFPENFRQIASQLPFRSTLGLPMEILMGRLTWPEIGFGFGVTLVWCLIFLIIYRVLWRLGLRRYEAVGA